jgi:hypothetical protein
VKKTFNFENSPAGLIQIMTVEMFVRKWRSNKFIVMLFESMFSYIFAIIDGNVLKQHCITCENVVDNGAISF